MGIFSRLFEKKQTRITEDFLNIINEIGEGGLTNVDDPFSARRLTILNCILNYLLCGPVAESVDMIAEKVAGLEPVLQASDGTIIREHELLSKLKHPNDLDTRTDFLKKLVSFYLITGNTYLLYTGNANFPPAAMSVLYPQHIVAQSFIRDLVRQYGYFTPTLSMAFEQVIGGEYIRYLDTIGMAELVHIKDFSPDIDTTSAFGVSRQNAIQLEIRQFIQSNVHNFSTLKSGARLSGILLSEGALTKDQREFIKQQFQELYAGASKAGKTLLMDNQGGKMDYKPLSVTSRDMDYGAGKTDVRNDIYRRYDIPLPLVSTASMTYSNYKEALRAFYYDAVFPTADKIFEELQETLFPRYNIKDNLTLTYDKAAVPAIKEAMLEELKARKESGALTRNELRNLQGYDDRPDGDTYSDAVNALNATDTAPDKVDPSTFKNVLRDAGIAEKDINNYVEKYYA